MHKIEFYRTILQATKPAFETSSTELFIGIPLYVTDRLSDTDFNNSYVLDIIHQYVGSQRGSLPTIGLHGLQFKTWQRQQARKCEVIEISLSFPATGDIDSRIRRLIANRRLFVTLDSVKIMKGSQIFCNLQYSALYITVHLEIEHIFIKIIYQDLRTRVKF
jgi:hypothetical protein